jgi:hypothetical protein
MVRGLTFRPGGALLVLLRKHVWRWFAKIAKARAEACGPTRLLIRCPSAANVAIELASSRTIGFIHIGEAFSFVHEGWWVLGTPTGAVAVSDQCPYADLLLRDAELNVVAERIPDKLCSTSCPVPGAFAVLLTQTVSRCLRSPISRACEARACRRW